MTFIGVPTYGVPLYGVPAYSIPSTDSGGGGGSDGGVAGPERLAPGVYWASPYTGLAMGVY